MLTLVIAHPRTGKSQLAVKMALDHQKEGKRVFVTNFNQTPEQLKESGFERYDTPNEWWGPDPSGVSGADGYIPPHPDWKGLPHGAVWIVDECQEIWPQRDKHTKLPDYIKLLSKHGHHDLTIYLLTQDAMQLDVHVRRNSNITLHMTRPLMMRKANIYTFRGYQEMPNDAWRRSQVWKSAESKTSFKYSKKYQRLYTSASAHESIKLRIPPKLLLLPLLVIGVLWLLYFAYSRITGGGEDDTSSLVGQVAAKVTGAEAPTAAALTTSYDGDGDQVLTVDQYLAQWKPRVEGLDWSAPAYDGFEVQDYPRPYCIIVGLPGDDECNCYTQQATALEVSKELCLRYVRKGVWDPFKKPLDAKKDSGSAPESDTESSAGVGQAAVVIHAPPMTDYGGFRSSAAAEVVPAPVQ